MKEILNEDKIFIMVIGGIASGKSYFIENNLKGLKLFDPDEYTFKNSKGDWELARKLVSKSIHEMECDIQDYLMTDESLVNCGSGAALGGVMKKFQWAKDCNYKTAIILIDVNIKVALSRNQLRANKGDRNLVPDYKVERSNNQARENFKEFAKIADYSIKIEG